MDPPAFNQLLIVTKEQFENVRKSYNVTRESLQADIDNLISWYSQQPHLPSVEIDPEWVERILVMNKCSMERAKKRLDMVFTYRNFMEYFQNRDPERGFEMVVNTMFLVPLPKLMPDNTRVYIAKVNNPISDKFDIDEYLKVILIICEYTQRHDYCMGNRIIVDLTGHNMGYFLKCNPGAIKKSDMCHKEVFGSRLAGIHLLYMSTLLDKIVILAKMVFSKKIAGRIQVHPDLASLHEIFPKDILPKEYGGDEVSIDDILDNWRRELCSPEHVKWMKVQDNLKSDESKRIGEAVTDELLGIPGSFRKLVVD